MACHVDTLERALRRIGRNPHAGALRLAFELDIPGLRHVGLARFPFAVFYMETTHEIDVWRVLHTRRDLPSQLTDPR